MRRWISLAVTVAMLFPAVASVAEGAMANWLSPQPGQIVSGGKVEVAIGYNTGSKLKVSSLELYIDGQFYVRKILRNPESRGVCSFWWDTTRVEQGSHNLIVKVYSGDQVISKVYGSGTVGPNGTGAGILDVRPPIVTFANIKAGDVIKGTKTVKMNAVDDSGKPPMVSLLVDNNLKLLKNTRPYSYDLDTTTYADGDHSIKTYAYDEAGNRSDPAVIKVAFRNGDARPVVATLTVNPAPESSTPPAKISKVIPPSVAADTHPAIKKSSARIETPSVAAPSSAAPVVAPAPKLAVKPDVKPVSVPAPAVKLSAPVLSTTPVKMASAGTSTSLRRDELKPSLTASVHAAKPAVVAAPSLSGLHNAGAAKLPAARPTLMSAPALASSAKPAVPKQIAATAPKPVVPKHVSTLPKPVVPKQVAATVPKPVEPKHVVTVPKPVVPKQTAPKPSEPVRMAMASAPPAVHKVTHTIAPSPVTAAVPKVMAQPVSAPLKNVPIQHRAAVKSVKIAGTAPAAAEAVAPKIIAPPRISKSVLKRVRVAMAPDIRTAEGLLRPSPAISSPPPPAKSTKARLEKAVVPASGKVKARSFFQDMGGVLFWNPATHTVTACVAHMVIEMQIGSKTARVNGHEFTMESAPYLMAGRTFFEARSFTQAGNLLENLQKVSKAEVH